MCFIGLTNEKKSNRTKLLVVISVLTSVGGEYRRHLLLYRCDGLSLKTFSLVEKIKKTALDEMGLKLKTNETRQNFY